MDSILKRQNRIPTFWQKRKGNEGFYTQENKNITPGGFLRDYSIFPAVREAPL